MWCLQAQCSGGTAPVRLMALGLVTLALTCTAAGAQTWSKEYYHDFQTQPIPPELTFFNANGEKFFQVEPEGLRITIPKTWIHPWGGVGFQTAFGLQGDFEITTTFEILQAEVPPAGYGVGVLLHVRKVEPSPGVATLCRLVRAGDRQVVLWDRAIEVPGGNPRIVEGATPCTARVGRLRLKRTGATLHYLWAPGTTGEEFTEIHQCEFGAEDIKRVRFGAVTGRQPCHLDARFLDLRIRSSAPAAAPVVGAAAASPPRSRWKIWLAGAIAALAVALSLAAWLLARRGRGVVQPGPAEGGEGEGKPGPEPTSAPVLLACPGCGKQLRVKAEWAGKKAKCPYCRQSVPIPAGEGSTATEPGEARHRGQ